MIPVRDPGSHLETAIGSALAQLRDADAAQIAVVDDGSRDDITPRVRAVDPSGRVEIYRFDRALGISGNLNRAIGLALGHLVHLLHQDDFVLPGFYSRMQRAFEQAPLIGMAFCRTQIVDRAGRQTKLTSGPRLWSGPVSGWLAKIAVRQRVQAPSAVVARTTYETVGGYREDLRLALDWEMWVRIAARYPVWFEARTLAAFRRHQLSETERVRTDGLAWPDVVAAIRLNAAHCRSAGQPDAAGPSARWHARSAMREALRLHAAGRVECAERTLEQCRSIIALASPLRLRGALERRLAAVESHLGIKPAR
jgi:glycosyltransferase involved in cell wall biosynthesis